MDIKIMPGVLSGTVGAISSKSQAHRALICAALAKENTYVKCESESRDIDATALCLSALGAKVVREIDGYNVQPVNREEDDKIVTLPCGESGSTFRFMLPIVGALGRKASFTLEGRLPERPLSPLYEELLRHGCELSPQGSSPFFSRGQLLPGSYCLDAGVSSQFISGLLFALPLLGEDSELRLYGKAESFPYIELTLAMTEQFGVRYEFENMVFYIRGSQRYSSPGSIRVEGDWSNAAFWLASGAIGGDGITCTGLDLRSRQGDRAILDILSEFGANVMQSDAEVTVRSAGLRGIEIDAQDIPDLVPILSVVAVAAEGVTKIRNAGRLRDKESDRLAAVTSVLSGLGAKISETSDGLVIYGGTGLAGGSASSWGDHRIAMSAAIAATICTEPVHISNAEAVNKSYPGFFEDMSLLGGQVIM